MPRIRLCIHGNHDVDTAGAGNVPVLGHADFIPGGQALDVGGKIVFPHDRDAAAEDGLHQQRIGAGGAGAVHSRDLDDEIVDHAIFGSFAFSSRASSSAS